MNKKDLKTPTAGEVKELTEGEIPYILTRLEWLEVRLNSIYSLLPHVSSLLPHVSQESYSVSFDALPSQNTMIINIIHPKDKDQNYIDFLINRATTSLSNQAKHYGWEWVKPDVRLLEMGI